jgi:hypothetical protein
MEAIHAHGSCQMQSKHVNPLCCRNLEAVEHSQIVIADNSSSDIVSLLCVCSGVTLVDVSISSRYTS